QLEGIALTGGISRIEVSLNPTSSISKRHGPVDACSKVISEKPHQERAAEDKNGDFKSQEEMQSIHTEDPNIKKSR
ncbi:MAG: hypothetical protein ABIC40_02960, partial [bacterium]